MKNITVEEMVIKAKCEKDHLFFSRYFFKQRQNIKFIVNWHHKVIADVVERVIKGELKNVVINVPPGSSKTELVVINLIARGLALNPWSRFLHLSYSDDLALLNSQTARDLVASDEFQRLWPNQISDDNSSKKRWNIEIDGKTAGGVYATSLAGQITGFRAGHMTEGWNGCIIIDDPLKPEDAYSEPKLTAANRKLLSTVKSRKANPDTPIILIMQRISERDPTEFIRKKNLPGDWEFIVIPSILDKKWLQTLPKKYQDLAQFQGERESYWPYKEPLDELLILESGSGEDKDGSKIGRQVFAAQYQQNPIALGGNLIRGEWFKRHSVLPKIKYRKIFADTAQKTAERNDFTVFGCFGLGEDNLLYLLDLVRGKWEAPDLRARAVAFWNKHKAIEQGQLREFMVEDKSSGTGLIQDIRRMNSIPIKGIERDKDKLTRLMDVVSYIEMKMVSLPEDAPFISDFLLECEAFTADDSHAHDDQVDILCDAVSDMISSGNKLRVWEKAAGYRN